MKQIIQKIINTIVQTVSPQKIIFFGSRSIGNFRSDSDYDFMVIKKDVVNEREVSRKIYGAFFKNHIKQDVDIVVVSEAKLKSKKNNFYQIYSWALKEGKVVYG